MSCCVDGCSIEPHVSNASLIPLEPLLPTLAILSSFSTLPLSQQAGTPNLVQIPIRLDRSSVHAYRSKASVLEKLRKHEEARVAYQEALTAYDKVLLSEPKDFFVHFFRADVLKHLQRYEEASAEIERAEQLAPHPWFAVHCIFAGSHVDKAREAKTRLQAAGKEINDEAIEAEIHLMGQEQKIASLKSSPLFQPICVVVREMQEWSGTPKQFKELLATRFPDDLKKAARSPARLVETLKEITPALQEEGIVVGLPPETALVTLTCKSI